jgi:hypothetical protein
MFSHKGEVVAGTIIPCGSIGINGWCHTFLQQVVKLFLLQVKNVKLSFMQSMKYPSCCSFELRHSESFAV